MKADADLIKVYQLGLEAMDWVGTRSLSPTNWIRYAKFGRGAMYLMLEDVPLGTARQGNITEVAEANEVWFSRIDQTIPQDEVIGPTLDQIFDTGSKSPDWTGQRPVRYSLDADQALNELGKK